MRSPRRRSLRRPLYANDAESRQMSSGFAAGGRGAQNDQESPRGGSPGRPADRGDSRGWVWGWAGKGGDRPRWWSIVGGRSTRWVDQAAAARLRAGALVTLRTPVAGFWATTFSVTGLVTSSRSSTNLCWTSRTLPAKANWLSTNCLMVGRLSPKRWVGSDGIEVST